MSTAEWPVSRLVETWNSFAGVAPFDELKPVRKFTDRKAAVARIFKAVERLSPDVAPQSTPVATERTRSKKSPAKAARRARAQKGATESRTNKKAEVIAMMKRAKGATLDEIMEATGWQKHTIRGFVSILASKAARRSNLSKTRQASARIASGSSQLTIPFQTPPWFPTGGVLACGARITECLYKTRDTKPAAVRTSCLMADALPGFERFVFAQHREA